MSTTKTQKPLSMKKLGAAMGHKKISAEQETQQAAIMF
jgi:hypothetical protein